MKELLFLVPVVGLAGLLFAIFLKSYVIKQDPGTDRMREIADAIAEGARAFLASEYRILVIFRCCIICRYRCWYPQLGNSCIVSSPEAFSLLLPVIWE